MTYNNFSRRMLIASSAMLAFPSLVRAQVGDAGSASAGNSSILVAWFSRSGNTKVIAGQIRRATGADEFAIEPADAYPEDYEETVAQSRSERDAGFEPELASTVPDIARYETIYLGFPIWSGTAPPVIRSFLRRHDLSGKTVVPFITHGGYGLGNSSTLLAELAPNARLVGPFSLKADQERQTLEEVTRWLNRSTTR